MNPLIAGSLTILDLTALTALVAWLWLAFFHGRFWRADELLEDIAPEHLPAGRAPSVTVLIPARDEAATIAAAVRAVLAQEWTAEWRLVLIDDQSSDGTGDLARKVIEEAGAGGRATVLEGTALPSGWSGKLWALEQGRRHPFAARADFLWLTDADIVHGPRQLVRMAALALAEDRAMVSAMVRLHATDFWERLLIPAFVYFFQMLYPFSRVNAGRAAAAAGGSILVERVALERAGGFAAWRDALIDDCALARHLRGAGGRLWLGLSRDSRSLRHYSGLAPLWNMVRRTAYSELRFSPWRLMLALAGLALVFLMSPIALIVGAETGDGPAALAGGFAWGVMSWTWIPNLRHQGVSPLIAPALPLVTLLYMAMTLHSAIDAHLGRKGGWKGRHYGGRSETAAGVGHRGVDR
ncbi:MAG: glycosyltransferase [Alphaproteobacteria bacterium]|nr:MAG: glycosyltransferase [Alphaproteobacteria bacterium]